jgi:4-hydroxy-tetrahydrodipicolinate reductase
MKLALIGQGAMGHLVATEARKAGDEIGLTLTSLDANRAVVELSEELRSHDVAIDFSVSSGVLRNIEACALAGVPLVEGTTGWQEQSSEANRLVTAHDGALVYGANFSIGVNLFYRIASNAAALFASAKGYAAFIEEAHHSRKRDAPSGTALRLQALLNKHLSGEIPVASTRAGYIPGTHRVGFDSVPDQITLTHEARSREGFAAGALLAARWIVGRKGVYEFSEVIDEIIAERSDVGG